MQYHHWGMLLVVALVALYLGEKFQPLAKVGL